jgi:transcription initiation factor TFIIH subunit 4
MDLVEALSFVFQLGCLELGKSYVIETLTETQKIMLEDLKSIGVIYQKKVLGFYFKLHLTC